MEDKVMLLQYASICVLVGDQNEHKNKPYRITGEKIDKHCHFIKLSIIVSQRFKSNSSMVKNRKHNSVLHIRMIHKEL